MRVEDVDTGRSRERFVLEQQEDLRRIGLDWDGEVVRQSERHHLYAGAAAQLDTYPCWCTRAEIRQAAAAPHGALPEGAYPGTCRELTKEQRAQREREGRPKAIRVRSDHATVTVQDRLRGPVTSVVDDLVLKRTDGDWAYNLAVVVDDHEQGVGEVVRGADLLESTPRQVWLHQALGYGPPPGYAHVALLLGPDGKRLAKRHAAVTLHDRTDSPEDVRAELAASVGLQAPEERLTPQELLARFDPARL